AGPRGPDVAQSSFPSSPTLQRTFRKSEEHHIWGVINPAGTGCSGLGGPWLYQRACSQSLSGPAAGHLWKGGPSGQGRPGKRGAGVTLLLIVLLVLLWGAVIVPTLLRVRQSPSYSVGAFRRNMQALGSRSAGRPSRRCSGSGSGGAGRWILGPPPRPGSAAYRQSAAAHPQRRPVPRGYPQRRRPARGGFDAGGLSLDQRRTIFFMLLTAAAFTLMLGLAFSLLLRI